MKFGIDAIETAIYTCIMSKVFGNSYANIQVDLWCEKDKIMIQFSSWPTLDTSLDISAGKNVVDDILKAAYYIQFTYEKVSSILPGWQCQKLVQLMWSKNESNRVEHRNWGQVITNLSSSYDFYVNNIQTASVREFPPPKNNITRYSTSILSEVVRMSSSCI